MAKKLIKYLDDLSPSENKLRDLPRKPDGLYNLFFNQYGQEVKRAGYSKYNDDSIGADHPIKGMHRFYKMDTLDKQFLVAWNTNVYKFVVAPTATSWDLQYLCTVEPDAADPVWTLGGTDYASCTAGILTIDTSDDVARICYYYRTPDIDFSTGFLVQFKAQVVSSAGIRPFKILINDGSQNQQVTVYFRADSIYRSATEKICDFDTTAAYAVYKIVVYGTTATLYIDDVYKGEWAVSSVMVTDGIYFGDTGGTSSTKIKIDYLYYTDDFTVALTDSSIKSGLTADSDTYFCDFFNRCYFLNGVDGVFKYDLANVRTVCPDPPDAATKNALTDGALGTGNYKYKITYVDEDGYEGNGGTSVTIAAEAHANDGIRLNIPSANVDAVTFVGVYGHLDDATSGGCFTGNATIDYKVQIDAGDPTDPNTFKWSDDGGLTWDVETVAITGAAQDLNNGVTITFAATTGHTLAEYWTFSCTVDPKIAKRRIYRTALAGAIYYYDGEVADNTTNTYDSIIADSLLGTILHTNHTVPPTTSHLITKRREKLYIADNQYVYPSHISDVEYFPATWRQRVGNSQKITGLLELLTDLPVVTEDSIERLTGMDKDNFEFRNAYSKEGCIAKRSYVNCDNLAVYLGFNGINWFNGTTGGIFSKALNKYIKDNIVEIYAYLSCAVYWEDKYILCYPKTGGTYPTETIWIDLKNHTYGVYSFAFSCFSLWDRGTDGLQLKGGSNIAGRVYSVFSGLDDDTAAITAYDDIEPLDFGKPEVYKQWLSVFVKIKTTTGTALAMYYTLDNGTETSANMVSRDDIAFVDGGAGLADTITTVAGDFVAAGFKAEDVLVVTGTDSNNGNMTIVSLVAKTITLATAIVTAEAAGDAILTKAKVLTADTTKWYRIGLGSGGKLARALKPRPYMSDKYAFEIHGYAFCYNEEPFVEERD